MAKSTAVLTDATTLADGSFTAASKTKALAAAGPIGDLASNASLILSHVQDLKRLAVQMQSQVDASDPLKTTLDSIVEVLV